MKEFGWKSFPGELEKFTLENIRKCFSDFFMLKNLFINFFEGIWMKIIPWRLIKYSLEKVTRFFLDFLWILKITNGFPVEIEIPVKKILQGIYFEYPFEWFQEKCGAFDTLKTPTTHDFHLNSPNYCIITQRNRTYITFYLCLCNAQWEHIKQHH